MNPEEFGARLGTAMGRMRTNPDPSEGVALTEAYAELHTRYRLALDDMMRANNEVTALREAVADARQRLSQALGVPALVER
jgi:hypothetical protein